MGAYSEVFCFQRHLHFCTLAVWWVALFHRTCPTLTVPESSWIKGVVPFSVELSLLPALPAPDAAPHCAQQDSCNQDEHSHSTPEKRFPRISFPQRIPKVAYRVHVVIGYFLLPARQCELLKNRVSCIDMRTPSQHVHETVASRVACTPLQFQKPQAATGLTTKLAHQRWALLTAHKALICDCSSKL